MSCMFRWISLPALLAMSAVAFAAPAGLDQTGKPDLKSAGSLAFGPKGVLFVGDPQGAQVIAIDVGTAPTNPIGQGFKLEGADAKIAAFLGTKADDITINDVVVEPGTNIAYVSVSRGKGPSAEPAIVLVDGKGNVTALSLDKVAYSKVSIANAPARTFVPFNVGGQPQILAAYTCTPLVTFPVSALKPGEKVRGRNVAELG